MAHSVLARPAGALPVRWPAPSSACSGLLLGPIIGTFAGEIIGGQRLVAAGRAGWGALLGNLAGTLAKLLIALAMVGWFLVAVPAPF